MEESRTITYDKKQRCTDQCGGVMYNWLRVSTTETRWFPITIVWEDTGETRNRVESAWTYTGKKHYDDAEVAWYEEQERTVTWEKEQRCTNCPAGTQNKWIAVSEEETRWVLEVAKTWEDTGETRNTVEGEWSDTGRTQTDPVTDEDEKEQTRTVTWDKEQRCTNCPAGTANKWVSASRVDTRWVPYTPPPPPPPVVTHSWTHVRYEGCGPTRDKVEACSNGHARHTRTVDAPEPYRWRTVNDGSPTTTYTAWSNLGEPYLSGSSCKQVQIRQSTTVQRRKQVNHCNDGVERPADPVRTTTYQRQVITVSETWGDWSYTGGTDYDDIEDVVYYQQERFSSPCNRRETRWVTTRP